MNKFHYIYISIIVLLLNVGCSKPGMNEDDAKRTVRIAVVLPQDSYDRWNRIMKLSQKNISEGTDICPVFEFYDEDSHDLLNLAYQLAMDTSIDCVIGCMSEKNTDALAYQMSRLKVKKPMFTFNTSQEIIRKYTRMGFMWGLSETDITQSEILLAQIAQDLKNTEVALLTNKSTYGQTFLDWFAFQATELGLRPMKISTYDNINEIPSILEEISAIGCPIVCVPNTPEEAVEMAMNTKSAYFSHKAFSNRTLEILKNKLVTSEIEMRGVTMVADPQSGFHDIYTAKYGQTPAFGEAQLYDAIMISCLAYAAADEFDISMNNAVSQLLAAEGKHLGGWTSDAIRWSYNKIVNDHSIPAISGAVGELAFSPDKHTNINQSIYAVQYLSQYRFHQTDYVSREGNKASSSVHSAWTWNKIFDQEFDYSQEDYEAEPHKGNKAVLISTSTGWDNYRHQADILSYYQLLKGKKFTDDDIILIIADDLVDNPKNPYPGQVIKNLENIYVDVQVDYRLDQITPFDLKNILLGNSSEKLPVVLDSGKNDNVLFIWSGHGKPNTLLWDENQMTVTGKFLSDLFNEMYTKGKYRKLFGMIEACYGGSVAAACTGTPRLLLMTAANDKETSKAEGYSSLLKTYQTNSFMSSILSAISNRKDNMLSLRDMYVEAFSKTMGSHVTLYNDEFFGNVYFNYIDDYIFNASYWDQE